MIAASNSEGIKALLKVEAVETPEEMEEVIESEVCDEAAPSEEEEEGQRAKLVDVMVQGVDVSKYSIPLPEDSLDAFMKK
eukprot:3671713-Pyramimonas_sp.AAC.1